MSKTLPNHSSPGGGHPTILGRARWREIGILYAREMRSALRERSIVINSLLLPVLLYPFLLWVAFTAMLFIQGQTEGLVSRIFVNGWPPGHPKLRRSFELEKLVEIISETPSKSELKRKLREGQLELVVQFLAATNATAGVSNFTVTLLCNEARERSLKARETVEELLRAYRQDWLLREASKRGISSGEWRQFSLASRNIASSKQVGGFILGWILPILFVVMVAMGCFFPAVDSTAGERERSTWETLMSTCASRTSIIIAKYLYVATLGGIAGVLNLAAMLITVKPLFAPLLAKAGEKIVFALPLAAIPIMLASAFLLAAFVAAGMMVFAAFARTFKEGQAMITPFYLLILLPLMFLQVPGLKFSVPLAFVPVVNVLMMVRSSISGEFPAAQILITMISSGFAILLILRLARYVMQFEEVLVGSHGGSLARFLKHRIALKTFGGNPQDTK